MKNPLNRLPFGLWGVACALALTSTSARAEVLLPPSLAEARALGSRVLDPRDGALEVHIDRLSIQGLHFKVSGYVMGAQGFVGFEAIHDLRERLPRTVEFDVSVSREGEAGDCGVFHRETLHVIARPTGGQRAVAVGGRLTVEHSDENCGIAGPVKKSLEFENSELKAELIKGELE